MIDLRAAARALSGDVIGPDAVAAPGPTSKPEGIVGLMVKLDRPIDRERPIVVRKSHTYEEEAPPTETQP